VPDNDLVRRDVAAMTDDDLTRTYRIAKALALSKRFPDARTADEAFAKILVGRDLGLSPTQALTGLHIVEGKPQIAAVTLAGFVRKSARYDYAIEEHTAESCTILFWVDGDEGGRSTFTIEEARTAGLVKDKSNWAKWPKNMLFARAMSNGVKWFCPDLMGGVPIYTEADVFEGTASELTAGEGTGEPVGWKDISTYQIAQLEDLLRRAEARGHAGFAHRPTVEMIVNGQTERFIADWISLADEQLAEMKVTPARAEEVADVLADVAQVPADIECDGSPTCPAKTHIEGCFAGGPDPIPGQESLDVEEAER
jgi:hypothetical protein